MIVLGLTGSIGMGKSTAAATLRRLGLPVQEADAVVHALYAPGGAAVRPIEAAFPGVLDEAGGIDRAKLSRQVIGNKAAFARLEGIVHPLVGDARDEFLRAMARRGERLVVLDIPLMFEAGLDRFCDAVIVVTAPAFVQAQRVMARPGMTADKLARLLAQQMPDAEKRRRADFVVQTGNGRNHTLRRLGEIVETLRGARPLPGPPGRRRRRKRPGMAHARNRP
jgi:dephospho-CoA kinase